MILWFKRAVFITITLALIIWMVANRQAVVISFAPLPYEWSAPLYLVLFAGIFIGLLMAGIVTSIKRAQGALSRQRIKRENAQLSSEKDSLEEALNEQLKHGTPHTTGDENTGQKRLSNSSS